MKNVKVQPEAPCVEGKMSLEMYDYILKSENIQHAQAIIRGRDK